MGGMDGQKALGIELLSIQSMDAGAGRRWRPDEVGGLGLHGAAKDEVAGVGLGTKQGRRSSCSGRCGEGNRVEARRMAAATNRVEGEHEMASGKVQL